MNFQRGKVCSVAHRVEQLLGTACCDVDSSNWGRAAKEFAPLIKYPLLFGCGVIKLGTAKVKVLSAIIVASLYDVGNV